MKRVMVVLLRLVCSVLVLASLWGGCYALSEAKGDGLTPAWWAVPTYITMCVFIVGGCFVVVFAKDLLE